MSDLPPGWRLGNDGIPEIRKSPTATLDYSINWLGWLQTGETISTATWTVPSDLTKVSENLESGVATVELSGGTADNDYVISATIATNQGRTDTRSIRLLCRLR